MVKEEVKKTEHLDPQPEPPIKHKETKATINAIVPFFPQTSNF